jgi:predicted DNA-binding transcriptional regulator AlpA
MSICELLPDIVTTPATPPPTYFSLAELSTLLHVSGQTIRRWYGGDGRFPKPLKIGRRLLFDAAEVRTYLEQLRTTGATPAG